MSFENILDLVQLLIVIVGLVVIHRRYPAGKIDELIDKLGDIAPLTDNRFDDLLLIVAELIRDSKQNQPPSNTP